MVGISVTGSNLRDKEVKQLRCQRREWRFRKQNKKRLERRSLDGPNGDTDFCKVPGKRYLTSVTTEVGYSGPLNETGFLKSFLMLRSRSGIFQIVETVVREPRVYSPLLRVRSDEVPCPSLHPGRSGVGKVVGNDSVVSVLISIVSTKQKSTQESTYFGSTVVFVQYFLNGSTGVGWVC